MKSFEEHHESSASVRGEAAVVRSSDSPRGVSSSRRGSTSSKFSRYNQRDRHSVFNTKTMAGSPGKRNILQNSRYSSSTAHLAHKSTLKFSKENNSKLERRNPSMISYHDVVKIYDDLQEGRMLPGSSDLIESVQRYGFAARLNDLFDGIEERMKFLYVVVAIVSINHAYYLRTEFLTKVLESTMIGVLIDENVSSVAFRPQNGTSAHGELFYLLLTLLIHGFKVLPTKMNNFIVRIRSLIIFLKTLNDTELLSDATKLQLENLEIIIKEHINDEVFANSSAPTKIRLERKFAESVGGPPNDFRHLSIIPRAEDIIITEKPYLRAIKIKGPYATVEDYLDTQFRLLREDYLRPLREAIEQYHCKKKGANLYVYHNIQISLPRIEKRTGQLLHYASFKSKNKMRWDKFLKYGSLVCLSQDDFRNNFSFGTVVDREALNQNKIGLKIETSVEINKCYSMVESPAFFESYRHVMAALQAYNHGEDIPFSRYLVNVELNNMLPPYLAKKIDLSGVILSERRSYFSDMNMDVREIQHRLRPDDLGMDVSQFNAFCYTFSTDMAIIQGPPGTGKTFMGLKIANVLLRNVSLWNPVGDHRPILIVCYTNHALDQFLEGVTEFLETRIVRVGGRSKNPAMEKYMINNARNEHVWTNKNLKEIFYLSRNSCNYLAQDIHLINIKLNRAKRGIVVCEDFSSTDVFRKNPKLIMHELYCAITNQLHDKNIALWLEQNSNNSSEIKINFDLLAIFVKKFRFSEIVAMNLTYWCMKFEIYDVKDIANLLDEGNNDISNFGKTKARIAEIAHWPSLSSLNYFMQQGFSSEQAYELLTDSKRSPYEVRAIHNQWNKIDNLIADEMAELTVQSEDQEEHIDYDDLFSNINLAISHSDEHLNIVSKMIRTASPLPQNEVEKIKDLWDLPLQDRWRLCRYCLDKRIAMLTDANVKLELELHNEMQRYSELRTLRDIDVMKSAEVVGMTTTGAARLQAALRTLRSRIVIVEEAAEVFEAHILSSLTVACEQLILIGDHQQLRPSPASYELEKKYNLSVSLFERMVNNNFPYQRLKKQHRMCPDISRTLMPYFYADLEDNESVEKLESVRGMQKNLFFLSHSFPEVPNDEFKSHKNIFEARFCISLARYFLQQNYNPDDITILCAYLDQTRELKKMAQEEIRINKIRIDSVDNYQGEECNIIILSLVRSNNPENKIGFLSIENRVCVALSRARCGLYIIGNIEFLVKNCSSNLWSAIRERIHDADCLGNAFPIRCQLHGYKQFIAEPNEFAEKSPEGGCLQSCNYRKDCGHACHMPCHADGHEKKCIELCPRSCQLNHPCRLRCYQNCGNCIVKVDKILPCSHRNRALCFQSVDKIKCSAPCSKVLFCGHVCKKTCGEICDASKCVEKVKKILPGCGHEAKMACFNPPTNYKCKTLVEKRWPICNHTEKIECYRKIDYVPCPKLCDFTLKKCEHSCKGTCGQCRNGRLHIFCESICNNILICRHACDRKCCQSCPPCTKLCETRCVHSTCGAKAVYTKMVTNKGRRCGETCPPCAEKCANTCEHRVCSKLCSEVCDVEPCTQPCKVVLPCTKDQSDPHYCVGVCGEKCLEICKICPSDKLTQLKEIFFGMEDEENAMFIKLEDCMHYFEVSGLDAYINMKVNDGGAVVPIDCPRCRTFIRNSKRYVAVLNRNCQNIEQIKRKIRGGSDAELALQFSKLKKRIINNPIKIYSDCAGLNISLKMVHKKLSDQKKSKICANWLVCAENILKFTDRIFLFGKLIFKDVPSTINWIDRRSLFEVLNRYSAVPVDSYLYSDLRDLTDRLDADCFSDQFAEQFNKELDRFHFIFELIKWLTALDADLLLEESIILNDLFARLHGSNVFEGKLKQELEVSFGKMKTLRHVPGYAVTKVELLQIKTALSLHITNWYTCSNGHPYGIGNCGGAMEISHCPECNEPIGGQNHNLIASNRASDLNDHNYSFPPGTRAPF